MGVEVRERSTKSQRSEQASGQIGRNSSCAGPLQRRQAVGRLLRKLGPGAPTPILSSRFETSSFRARAVEAIAASTGDWLVRLQDSKKNT